MFITPMPPTSRPTLEMAMAMRPIMPMMLSNCAMNPSAVSRSKLFGSVELHAAAPAQDFLDLVERLLAAAPTWRG